MKHKILLLLIGFALLTLLSARTPFAFANGSDELPPRPPTVTPRPEPPVGAHIVLQLRNQQFQVDNLFTVIQWQGADGVYHDVTGWHGRFSTNHKVRWWVDQKDFGAGPFMWSVYNMQDGKLMASSEPFLLPTHENETVVVYVDVNTEESN